MASSGQKTVTTAGTAERLASDQLALCSVYIKALTTNTGLVYIGNVSNDVTSANGYPLAAGDQIVLENVDNLNQIWVDAATSAEGVAWLLGRP